MDYTVAEYRDEDSERVARLHADLIGGGSRLSRRYLDWKYRENPFIASPLFFVVRQGDEIVGMRGLYGTSWTVGTEGASVVIPHADDLIIHPDHRNRGLFLLLHQATVEAARERGFPTILSLSGGTTTQQLSLVCGYSELGGLGKIAQPLIAPSLVRRVEGRALRALRPKGLPLPKGIVMNGICRGIASGPNIEATSEADHEGMGTVADTTARKPFRAVRSGDFFRWRLQNPDRVYRFVYWRDSALRGYMVLAWDPTMPHRVMIADHAVEDATVLAELFDALGDRDDLEYVVMSSTLSDDHRRCAQAAGFVNDPDVSDDSRRRFLFFPVTPTGDLRDLHGVSTSYPDHWTVSLLDTMAS